LRGAGYIGPGARTAIAVGADLVFDSGTSVDDDVIGQRALAEENIRRAVIWLDKAELPRVIEMLDGAFFIL
jgi:hypothetical protein